MTKTALTVVAVLLVAGCTATAPGSPDANPTGTTGSTGPDGCQLADVPTADDGENTPAYPSFPTELDPASVEQYVVALEEAYALHRTFDGSQDEVNVRTNQVSVEENESGYVVRIEEVTVSTYEGDVVGDDAWSAFYLVNESTVLRGEGHSGAPAEAPPQSEWQAVCE